MHLGEKSGPLTTKTQNIQLNEIYRRCEHQKKQGLLPQDGSAHQNDLKKVTQDLVNIIKNMQKQLQTVEVDKNKMEEIPSSIIQPKSKEFFKNVKPLSATGRLEGGNNDKKLDKKSESKVEGAKGSKASLPPAAKKSQGSKTSLSPTSKKSSNLHGSSSKGNTGSSHRRFSSFTTGDLKVRQSSFSKIQRRSSSLSNDPLKSLRDEVQAAIRDHKTFTVRGNYPAIRKSLLDRGWVEKFHISYRDVLSEDLKKFQSYSIQELLNLLKNKDLTATCKNLIKSKLLGAYQVDFYWGTNDESFKENPDKIKLTMINKLKRDIFSYTNKLGLCDANKEAHWYQKNRVSKLNHPRSYNLGKTGDTKWFIEDFNMTAAMSLLKWIAKNNLSKECKLVSPSGKIPLEVFEFAINECCKLIKKTRHEDIDVEIPEATEYEWNQFLEYYYKIVHFSNHFKQEKKDDEETIIRRSNYVLHQLRDIYSYLDMDGMMNIWMLKPTASSRGRGIHICRTVQYILKVVKQNPNVRYVIQKYIERPLLIHNTKFDIRQWFLISNSSPLTIWMYKESYLRFSSQTYNLRKLHESIHLTNNAVQSKYKNSSIDAALPSYNMWDSKSFQDYLSNIGYPGAFKEIIYTGMRKCIIAAVLMHQEKMAVRKNCFELYGADFILTEDFIPWLLEINSNPALYPSTPVTSRMCPKVLEDVIKVMVDYGRNAKADTGGFELAFKEKLVEYPPPTSMELRGVSLPPNYFFTPENELLCQHPQIQRLQAKVEDKRETLKNFGEEVKQTLKNLLDIIHDEKQKREQKHNVSCGSLFLIQ